jgi:FtsH-binding integral membrane protein
MVYDSDSVVKAGFIRKVYGILSIALLFTALGAAFFMLHTSTREFVLNNTGLLYAALFLPIGFIIALRERKRTASTQRPSTRPLNPWRQTATRTSTR